MPDDLPIYSESLLRSGMQFAELARLKVPNTGPAWESADNLLRGIESAVNVKDARLALEAPAAEEEDLDVFIRAHGMLFDGRSEAGALRATALSPIYPGQDCAPPEFIDRSLLNFFEWIKAPSFADIHPIERTALSLARIVDIWPFEFGNITMAIVFSNVFLRQAGLTPFVVSPQHRREFEIALAKAMTIETQPLVNAIYQTVKREMEALANSR
jgi:hypothetical protein